MARDATTAIPEEATNQRAADAFKTMAIPEEAQAVQEGPFKTMAIPEESTLDTSDDATEPRNPLGKR